MRSVLLFISLLFAAALVAPEALAQDIEDIDNANDDDRKKKKRKRRGGEDDIIREIVRGFHLKANVGTTAYLAARGGGLLTPGTTLGLSGGQEFIDTEQMSVGWEIQLLQALHNGARFNEQDPAALGTSRLIQGDIHSFSALAFIEASWYLGRRFGLGVRGGGGITLTPLLMYPDAYETIVVAQTWGVRPTVHDSPHPTFGAGPTIEYYTKLSHFSIGVDVVAFYALGLDLGVTGQGYLKYTF